MSPEWTLWQVPAGSLWPMKVTVRSARREGSCTVPRLLSTPEGGVYCEDCAELTVELRCTEYAQVFAGATAYGTAGAGTEDAVNGQVVAGKVFEGVFGVEYAGAFAAFAGDEFEVLFAGVEDDCVNAVALGTETGAGVDGVCAVVARADEEQDFGVFCAVE